MTDMHTVLPPLPLSKSQEESKERITVGGLKSFTDRAVHQKSDSRRRRVSVAGSEGDTTERRQDNSFNSKPTDCRNHSARTDPTFHPNKDGKNPDKQDCLAQLIRDDIDSKNEGNDDEIDVFSDSSTDDTGYLTQRQTRKRSFLKCSSKNATGDAYYPSTPRGGLNSDVEEDSSLLTDAELNKLKIMATLNKMGTPVNKTRSHSEISESEVPILEESRIKKKRGSISTRVLLAANRRQINMKKKLSPLHCGQDRTTADPSGMTEFERQKVPEMLKKPEMKVLESTPDNKPRTTATPEDQRATATRNTPKRRLKRSKMEPIQRFRKHARFLVLLLRVWRIHANAINHIFVTNNNSLGLMTCTNEMDLMFDVTQYKPVKEAKVSREAKRILRKTPSLRTKEESHYIQVALRNYRSIAEYPVKMQRMIAQRSWIESYDPKRVIVREGHVPKCFYFILSGSAIVSQIDGESSKTVMFLNRGDSFGDIAILNQTRRETTVISREKIELLCMSDTDFTDIFMSGGIRDPEDPFLKSISFLHGWPLEKLIQDPKKCIFSYFKRGTVLISDDKVSEWIFVIKSGSASILKRLQAVYRKPRLKPQEKSCLRKTAINQMKLEEHLSHEEKVDMLFEEESRNLEEKNPFARYFGLPEINIKTTSAYNELRQMRDEFVNQNGVVRNLESFEQFTDVDTQSDIDQSSYRTTPVSIKFKPVSRKESVSNILTTRAFLRSPGGHRASLQYSTSSETRRGLESRRVSAPDHEPKEEMHETAGDLQVPSFPSLAASPMNEFRIPVTEQKPVFVEVQNLTKGQSFGLTEILFEGQPKFSLVSNGAECIMIDKKFFLEHASAGLMVRLREKTFPYPSQEALQDNLESQFQWNFHKKEAMEKIVRKMKIRRADPSDARAWLNEPTAVG